MKEERGAGVILNDEEAEVYGRNIKTLHKSGKKESGPPDGKNRIWMVILILLLISLLLIILADFDSFLEGFKRGFGG
jgi:hypothetical protein